MNLIENLAGEVCKIILPINEEIFFGNPKSSLAICTLSSITLLKEIANSNLLSKVALAGRLFSENKGINSLVRYVISNKNLETILLCGKDTPGHRPGHSLLNLYKNGVDSQGKIIGSSSPDPVLTITKSDIHEFQTQIKLIDEIGETSISKIKLSINTRVKI
ncbi:MAG TPA: tetrahydromethanopterin S-methyltransferase subunit A [Nitrosopumilaceae archaeon]|nr:tetrahydromethanopterin S-methyltransferase subunit A [Nitrosopumilaceae archaeon]